LIKTGSAIFKAVAWSGTRTLLDGAELWAANVIARKSPQIALFMMSLNVRLLHKEIQLMKTGVIASVRFYFAFFGLNQCNGDVSPTEVVRVR
jgi:hypothetical protein